MVPSETLKANLELMEKYRGGFFVECGVWRGGMMAEMMKIASSVIGYDSFQGLPAPAAIDGEAALKYASQIASAEYYDNCRADFEETTSYLFSIGQNFYLYKGWFCEELFLGCPMIDVLRLDCDWHDSIKICLKHLFPKLKKGGIVIVDDYIAYDGCAIAVNEFVSDKPIRIREYKGVTYFIK